MSHEAHNPTNQRPGSDPGGQLEAYLDGLLEGEALSAFEQAVASSPALRAQVEAQRKIDASLERLFERAEPLRLPETAGAGSADGAATVAAPKLKLAGDGTLPARSAP